MELSNQTKQANSSNKEEDGVQVLLSISLN